MLFPLHNSSYFQSNLMPGQKMFLALRLHQKGTQKPGVRSKRQARRQMKKKLHSFY